jgi:hypothetical protein
MCSPANTYIVLRAIGLGRCIRLADEHEFLDSETDRVPGAGLPRAQGLGAERPKMGLDSLISMVEGRAPGGVVSPARRKRRPTIGASTGQMELPAIETGANVRRGQNSSDYRPHDNCYQDTPVLKKNRRKLTVSRCIYRFEIFPRICDKGPISFSMRKVSKQSFLNLVINNTFGLVYRHISSPSNW